MLALLGYCIFLTKTRFKSLQRRALLSYFSELFLFSLLFRREMVSIQSLITIRRVSSIWFMTGQQGENFSVYRSNLRQNEAKSGKIIDFGVWYNSPKSSKLWRYGMFNILFSHCYGPWKYHFLIAMNPFVTNVLDFDVTSCEVKDKSVTARKNVTKPGKWATVFICARGFWIWNFI